MLKNIGMLFLTSSFGLAAHAGSPVIKCQISQSGRPDEIISHPLATEVLRENVAEIVEKGKRAVLVTSNSSRVTIKVRDTDAPAGSAAVFSAMYTNLDGPPEKMGFTGQVTLRTQDREPEREILFFCWKTQNEKPALETR